MAVHCAWGFGGVSIAMGQGDNGVGAASPRSRSMSSMKEGGDDDTSLPPDGEAPGGGCMARCLQEG